MTDLSCIADRIAVARRYVRSIDVLRDLDDPSALEGYVPTPTVDDTLHRLLRGLADGSTHRAFRITGPYGAGKSAFLLFLARLFLEKEQAAAATRLLRARCPDRVPELTATRAYEPLVIVGRRAPLADLILEALARRLDDWRAPGRRPAVFETVARLQGERRDGRCEDAEVLETLREFARYVDRSRDGGGGVLLIIDEMGRCLEYAASRRGGSDTTLFQALGELAAGSGEAPLAIVGVLHQRFSEYASGLGQTVREDWSRSAERFEDLPFQESVEQVAFLLAEAIQVRGKHKPAIVAAADAVYQQAARLGLFPGRGAEIGALGRRLYPLHPTSVVALAAMARRFGQNERSAIGFLQSSEPSGFQDFAANSAYTADNWYQIGHLFDHLAARGEGGPRDGLLARRWRLLSDTLTVHRDLPALEAAVLKCVGLLSILEPLPGLRADAESLAFCLDTQPRDAVLEALDALVRRRMIYRRPHRSDYCLWASSSADLDGWLEEARRQVAGVTRVTAVLAALPAPRPIVAHKHYHETGTLRAFGVRFALSDATQTLPPPGIDGWVVVHPVHPDEDLTTAVNAAMADAGPAIVHCVRQVSPTVLAAASELKVWQWVADNCEELAVDDLARREVRERLTEAGAALADALAPLTGPASDGDASAIWLHAGRVVTVPDRAALHRLLSDVCDAVFAGAPIVHNELINRSKLSSAAASARMRLLELMATNGTDPNLGLTGAPPERAVLLSVLQAGGLHRANELGQWAFAPPPPGHPARWAAVWQGLQTMLVDAATPIDIETAMMRLAQAPYGLRQGVSLVLLTAFILARRQDVALFERNSFVPEVTGALLMRVARNPRNFAVRLVAREPSRASVLNRLASDLAIWRNTRPLPEAASITEGLMRWFLALPGYTRETRSIGPLAEAVRAALEKARDPISLVFEALPSACGLVPEPGTALNAELYATLLDDCLEEIGAAYERLRAEATKILVEAFSARGVGRVRDLVRLEYLPFETALTDSRMRAFVRRSADPGMPDEAWIDSIASLLTGRRPDAWRDRDLDVFAFEVRALVPRLARWLAAARAGAAAKAPVLSVHVVSPDGGEASLVVHPDPGGREELADQIRTLLQGRGDAAFLLGQLLSEEVHTRATKDSLHA